MLVGLRTRFDAVMIGAGTMRAERYGRLVADPEKRERREQLGLPHDPLMVIVSGRLDLPWDAPLFTEAAAGCWSSPPRRPSRRRPRPRCEVVRHEGGVDLAAALRHLRRGARRPGAALRGRARACTASCRRAGLVDELFLTIAPKLTGGDGARGSSRASCRSVAELELAWLLEEDGELFARYRRR